jgi:hypothetical protein
MDSFWILTLVGIIPYHVTCKRARNGQRLHICALFWSLELLLKQKGWCQWTLRIPLIEQMQSAVWAAVMRLKGGDAPGM